MTDAARPDHCAELSAVTALPAARAVDGLFIVCRASMSYLHIDHGVPAIIGFTREELFARGPDASARAAGSGPSALEREYDALIALAPAVVRSEGRLLHANGSVLWVQRTRQAVQVRGQWLIVVLLRVLADPSDATDKTADPQRPAEQHDQLDQLYALVDEQTLGFLDVGATMCGVLGYTREQFLATTPARLLCADEASLRAWLSGASEGASGEARETDVLRANGEHARFRVTPVTVSIDSGSIIVLTARDVTAQRAAEANLARLRSALDSASEAVALIDPVKLRYIDVNAMTCELLGQSREVLLSRPMVEFSGTGNSECDLRAMYEALIAQFPRPVTGETKWRRRDGRMVDLEFSRSAIRVNGQWVIVVSSRDVTERTTARLELARRMDELARSNRDLEQFAYMTSHDLTEPLRMVSAYANLIQRRYADRLDDDGREFLDFITGGANRMHRLISDMLVYSRSGRTAKKPKECDMRVVMDDVLANLSERIKESGAVVGHEGMPVLLADRTSMMQLLQNLVGNALKFSRGQPRVQVRCEQEPGDGPAPPCWHFSVSDNGIGIEPRHFERIFIVFQRLHARDAYDGTGIGLAICKKIVTHHGGRIWVESTPGSGTTFHFTIAVVPPDVMAASGPAAGSSG